VFQAQHDAEHIRVKGRCVAFRRLFGDRAGLTFRSGVVYGYVDTAEAGDCLVDEIANVCFLTHIRFHELDFGAEAAQFFRERQALLVTSSGNDELRAFLRERDGCGTANARQGAGDQNYWFGH
jgi:hypothetical protein